MPSFTKHLRRLSGGLRRKERSTSTDDAHTHAKQSSSGCRHTSIKWDLATSQQRDKDIVGIYAPTKRGSRASSSASGFSDASTSEASTAPTTPASTPDVSDFGDQLNSTVQGYIDSGGRQHPRISPAEFDSLYEDERYHVTVDEGSRSPKDVSNRPEAVPPETTSSGGISISHEQTSTVFSLLPRELWVFIGEHISTDDAASLAYCNRDSAKYLGPVFWPSLNLPANKKAKANFLSFMEDKLPDHILCKPCAVYHARYPASQRSKHEVLRSSYESKPLLASSCTSKRILPSTRLTLDRHLLFPLAKLAMAGEHYEMAESAPSMQLNRSWTPENLAWADIAASYTVDTAWTHKTRFAIARQPSRQPQLLMKATSTYYPRANLTASEQRLVLSCR